MKNFKLICFLVLTTTQVAFAASQSSFAGKKRKYVSSEIKEYDGTTWSPLYWLDIMEQSSKELQSAFDNKRILIDTFRKIYLSRVRGKYGVVRNINRMIRNKEDLTGYYTSFYNIIYNTALVLGNITENYGFTTNNLEKEALVDLFRTHLNLFNYQSKNPSGVQFSTLFVEAIMYYLKFQHDLLFSGGIPFDKKHIILADIKSVSLLLEEIESRVPGRLPLKNSPSTPKVKDYLSSVWVRLSQFGNKGEADGIGFYVDKINAHYKALSGESVPFHYWLSIPLNENSH